MKKIAKLSLVAAVAVAGLTNVNAASLEEAFAASKVKGEIKSQYFQKESISDVESSIWTNGGNLSLTTGSFNGLMAGVTFQTGHVATDDNVTAYNKDMNASGSVMSEAYLAYTLGNTTAKVGRQYITTPLVAGSGSRMFKQSFEGAVLVNTDIPNTTLVAAYVDKYQHRTSNAQTAVIGDAPGFEQVADGAYTVYAKNTSIANLAIQAQYAVIKEFSANAGEDVQAVYIDADYKLDSVTLSGQTFQSDNGKASNSDGALYGAKVAANIAGVSAMAAYTTTDDEANVINGLGSGADRSFTASPIAGGVPSYVADTDSYKVGLGYTIMGLGLNASYTNWDTAGSKDVSESNITAGYAFNKALSAKVMYSKFNNDATKDYNSRVYLSYKF